MIDNSYILDSARKLPCIEVIDGPAPKGARKHGRSFYPDQSECLVNAIKAMAKREAFCVAIDKEGHVQIYRRTRK